jgi:hypothetical protein
MSLWSSVRVRPSPYNYYSINHLLLKNNLLKNKLNLIIEEQWNATSAVNLLTTQRFLK